ncbi:MAG: glycosyltransferase [Tannerella sp.]|jgi:1,2-diacylglycerol 3-alpha-glucosyltransferase|nr:glycosyltransferase [Tannerella sp.]
MKILIINPILFTSENNVIPEIKSIKETMIYSMCLGFMAQGHQVTLAAAADYKPVSGSEAYDFEVLFFKSEFTRIFPPSVLPLSFEFHRFLKAAHPDYEMILSSETFSFATLSAAMICPSKTVIWQELMLHQQKFRKIPSKIWHRLVVPLFISRVRCVIPRSHRAGTFIRRYLKQVAGEYVDHGVNASRFVFSGEKERQVISSSRLVPGKNVESMIRVYSKLIKINGYEDVKMVIVGDGESKKSLETLVEHLALRDHVVFTGFLSQNGVNEVVKKSAVFMVNTLKDLNMVSIPESIASGTPVITNLLPASADYIGREKLGIAKDAWDAYDLKEIIDNNPVYVENCIRYRDKLTNRFSARKITEIFEDWGGC